MASVTATELSEIESYLSGGVISGVVNGEDWCGSGDKIFQSFDQYLQTTNLYFHKLLLDLWPHTNHRDKNDSQMS